MSALQAPHIQDFHDGSKVEPHWGYADRVIPCTVDAGSCEYLDVVYSAHDRGMIYVAVIWATIFAILALYGTGRLIAPKFTSKIDACGPASSDEDPSHQRAPSVLNRHIAAAGATLRHYLLPDIGLRRIFGRVTRFQVLILAIFAGYIIIWSFLGMSYKRWITPVKKAPGKYNSRSTLGPFADRVGVLAFALTPLSILLSSRESVLSLITGVPYHHFNFLHRWLGHIIFIQSSVHTIGWCIVEIRLYQPQPSVGINWIKQPYMIWGVVAMFFLTSLWVLSMPFAIRAFGYEFFRKAHYVLAMVYVGACWGHWEHLKVFLIPSLVLWGIDRAVRIGRSALLHYKCLPGSMSASRFGFSAAPAQVTYFPDEKNGDIVRLDFQHPQRPWNIGQYFYLCFTEGSIWQSHPLTPLSLPIQDSAKLVTHSYIFRAKKGETKRIAMLAAEKCAMIDGPSSEAGKPTTGVILTGPYGASIMNGVGHDTNIFCLAGGTGVTFVLPVLLHLANTLAHDNKTARKIELCWVVRQAKDVEWVGAELDVLRAHPLITVRTFVTRDRVGHEANTEKNEVVDEAIGKEHHSAPGSNSGSGSAEVSVVNLPRITSSSPPTDHHRPDVSELIRDFVGTTVSTGETTVFVSGPGEMVSEARRAAAACNWGRAVLKERTGDYLRSSVRFVDDNRLEF
ncbi:unnamed protein product [Tilletia controversa]|uniref:FAD-binding FR-type domain-containing protein n=3 Tax=Tilletia TaxID=13289 RepID=A0A8X7MRD6_9BASI|nr:hypothetical protein CF336_g4557 [Tilletia laevis]KAE8194508.1 hypothetical protein CF328_g4724 [Tilletia controversa]KAE8257036.1 hypothetical protein A4X03_0g4810 [Tilletia caries]KAE8201240.1 hypothetical protein CF335_g3786 [Tilletia laevis]KAE8245764.1 hypothetical protein A4X06_0g5435 [Tilletia controversa]